MLMLYFLFHLCKIKTPGSQSNKIMSIIHFLKRGCIISFFILPVVFSCAQSKSMVRNAHAYFVRQMVGNIAVDENGNPYPGSRGSTTYTAYIETPFEEIAWDTATILGKQYTILSTIIPDNTIEAGLEKDTRVPIIINKTKGQYLWKLEFVPVENSEQLPFSTDWNGILLKGIYKGKIFEKKIDTIEELYTPDAV